MNTELELIREFVNTGDLEEERDEIGTPEKLRAWLAAAGQPDGEAPVSDAAQRRAVAVREGIRALGMANNGEPLDLARLDALNAAAAELPVTIGVQPASWDLAPTATGVDAFLGRILAAMVRAMADGTWETVKACRNDTCRWLFIDESRNHSGTWCSMRVCGSRMKSRAYRARQREAASA